MNRKHAKGRFWGQQRIRIPSTVAQASFMEIEKTIGVISEAEASDAEAYHQSLSRGGGGGGQDNSDSVDGDELAEPEPPVQRKEILKALEAVERDSAAIADSFSSLFSSLRQSLSQATGSTVEHMNCFSDATGRLQECGK